MAKPSVQQLILDKVTSMESDVKDLNKKFDVYALSTNAEISDVKEKVARNDGFIKIMFGVFTAVIAGIISMFFGFFHK